MGLRIVLIPYAEYEPIQAAKAWDENAMYVCKTGEDTCEIYIRGQSCGRQNMATRAVPGVVTIGENLVVTEGRVSVDATAALHENNTKPITSAAVHEALSALEQRRTYVHEQNIASDVWIVNHNLNRYPAVTVIDSGNNTVVGEVHYLDTDSLQCVFSGAFSGRAILN